MGGGGLPKDSKDRSTKVKKCTACRQKLLAHLIQNQLHLIPFTESQYHIIMVIFTLWIHTSICFRYTSQSQRNYLTKAFNQGYLQQSHKFITDGPVSYIIFNNQHVLFSQTVSVFRKLEIDHPPWWLFVLEPWCAQTISIYHHKQQKIMEENRRGLYSEIFRNRDFFYWKPVK